MPSSPREVFLVFTRLALQGFGGVLPIAQREMVEIQGWLTRGEFLELLSVGQVLPGPNVVNVSLMIGDRFFGWRGAVAAVGGMLAAPLMLVLLLAALYAHLAANPVVSGALRGMGAVAAGLVVATALKLGAAMKTNPLGRPTAWTFAAATIAGVGVLRWPLYGVLAALAPPAMAMVWWRLKR